MKNSWKKENHPQDSKAQAEKLFQSFSHLPRKSHIIKSRIFRKQYKTIGLQRVIYNLPQSIRFIINISGIGFILPLTKTKTGKTVENTPENGYEITWTMTNERWKCYSQIKTSRRNPHSLSRYLPYAFPIASTDPRFPNWYGTLTLQNCSESARDISLICRGISWIFFKNKYLSLKCFQTILFTSNKLQLLTPQRLSLAAF